MSKPTFVSIVQAGVKPFLLGQNLAAKIDGLKPADWTDQTHDYGSLGTHVFTWADNTSWFWDEVGDMSWIGVKSFFEQYAPDIAKQLESLGDTEAVWFLKGLLAGARKLA